MTKRNGRIRLRPYGKAETAKLLLSRGAGRDGLSVEGRSRILPTVI